MPNIPTIDTMPLLRRPHGEKEGDAQYEAGQCRELEDPMEAGGC